MIFTKERIDFKGFCHYFSIFDRNRHEMKTIEDAQLKQRQLLK